MRRIYFLAIRLSGSAARRKPRKSGGERVDGRTGDESAGRAGVFEADALSCIRGERIREMGHEPRRSQAHEREPPIRSPRFRAHGRGCCIRHRQLPS